MSNEEQNKKRFRQFYAELFNQGKLSLADELFAPDFIDAEAKDGRLAHGPESVRQLVTMFHQPFSNFHFEVEEAIAEGETVAARVVFTGTHQGTFMGIAPTGRTIRWKQMHFFYFRDGKMVGHQAVRDDLSLRQQLGVLPSPAEKH